MSREFSNRWPLAGILAVVALYSGCSIPSSIYPPHPSPVTKSAIEGAVIGAMAGGYAAAWPVMAQGAGGGSSTAMPWIAVGGVVGALAGGTVGYLLAQGGPAPSRPALAPSGYDLLNPRAGQFDLQLENMSGFVGPGGGSLVRVREFSTNGTALHFAALGINTVQIPTLDLTFWLDRVNGVHFQFRYFDVTGSHFLSHEVNFNGATFAANQTLHAENFPYFSGALYYERRLTPWYQPYETGWPGWLRNWELRARFGLEFTYINWQFNGGRVLVTPTSKGEEAKEDFYHQELPIPTIGFEAMRRITDSLILDASVKGNWINRWNSRRDEGGTVWLSQSGAEGHLRLYYSNHNWLGPLQLMGGVFIYYYRQNEDSSEDGNFLRWSSYGPEYGLSWSF